MKRGILADREELKLLAGRIAHQPFDAIYDRLQKRCSLILESAPVAEQAWRRLWEQGHWNSAVEAARTSQGRMFDLLIAHHIEPNIAFHDRAVEELRGLARWTTWVDPCHCDEIADLCTAEAAVGAVVALDWLWEDLDQADRDLVTEAIREKAITPYLAAIEAQAWWYNCYHNWNVVINSGCGLAAMALADEDDSAAKASKLARTGLKGFFDAFGAEGGWDEGTGFWGYAMRYLVLYGEAAWRLEDDQRVFHARGMDVTGQFPIYFTPRGHAASFGDSPAVPLHGALYLLAKHGKSQEIMWWLDTYALHQDVRSTDYSVAGLAMLTRPGETEIAPQPKLDTVKVFGDIGWATIADHWPQPDFYVAAKTGDLAANHSQHDMNAIQLQVEGEMLLVEPGSPNISREYFSEDRSNFYEVQAISHNTIRVGENDHQIYARGSVIESACGDNYRWLACDGQDALGETIHFVRHVVMVVDGKTQQGRMVVVVDELNNPSPEKVELFWHTRGQIDLDEQKLRGTITGVRSAVQFVLASSVTVTADVSSRSLNRHGQDNILRVTGGVVGPAIMASVFSRERLAGTVELDETTPGHLIVKVGKVELDFARAGRHMKLENVKS